MAFYFRKSQRIASKDDFERVLFYKCFVCKGIMRLYSAPNKVNYPRFGVSVSKSCGNAVIRNRLKRAAREVFRLHQHEFCDGFDYILIFTQKTPKISSKNRIRAEGPPRFKYKDIERDFLLMAQMLEKKSAR